MFEENGLFRDLMNEKLPKRTYQEIEDLLVQTYVRTRVVVHPVAETHFFPSSLGQDDSASAREPTSRTT
jgi:hypothetical protein